MWLLPCSIFYFNDQHIAVLHYFQIWLTKMVKQYSFFLQILYHFMGNTYTTVLRPNSLGNIVECLLAVGVEGTATGLLLSCLASIIGNVCRPSTIYFLEFAVIAVLVCLIYFSLQLFQLPAILGYVNKCIRYHFCNLWMCDEWITLTFK